MNPESFQIRPLEEPDRDWVAEFLEKYWSSTTMIIRGRAYRVDEMPGFVAIYEGKPAGLVTYSIEGEKCEVTSMNSLVEGTGIGSALVEALKKVAVEAGCKRIRAITTNDNMAALRFWQKRGFTLAAVYPNAIEESRKLKPEIPLVGNDGILIRDEIELELVL